MSKFVLFLKLNHKSKAKSLLLFLVFMIAAVVISSTILVKKNNQSFYNAQIHLLIEDLAANQTEASGVLVSADDFSDDFLEEFHMLSDTVGSILSVFSMAGILITIWGGAVLLFFRDLGMQGSYAMCRMYGMSAADLFFKALSDVLLYGVLAGIVGTIGGFWVFVWLSIRVCGIDAAFSLISVEVFVTMLLVILLLVIISATGSLAASMFIYERRIVSVIYERREKISHKNTLQIAAFGAAHCFVVMFAIFGDELVWLRTLLIIIAIPTVMLYIIFHAVFSVETKKYRNHKPLESANNLSFRFLCTRHKKDAILAATISVGAILICFIMNIEFNIDGILRDSYRDRLGYSTGVTIWEPEDIKNLEKIEQILDDNGYTYTQIYIKWMNYSDLNDFEYTEGQLWGGLIGRQTDNNRHFFVEKGAFKATDYTIYHCNLINGNKYDLFGDGLYYIGELTENQYMTLVNYNILLNAEDYGHPIDNSWSANYLMDISMAQEKQLYELLADETCEIDTASSLIEGINSILSDYIMLVVMIGTMLLVVTGTLFYSIIQNDLQERRKELYLYRIFGASERETVGVVFMEYIMIALIASFSVMFVVMVLGELFFSLALNKHYPLSIFVTIVTTGISVVFVMICCLLAQKAARHGESVICIRDE